MRMPKLYSWRFVAGVAEPPIPERLERFFGELLPPIGATVNVPYHGHLIGLEVLTHRYTVRGFDPNATSERADAMQVHIEVVLGPPKAFAIDMWMNAMQRVREYPKTSPNE